VTKSRRGGAESGATPLAFAGIIPPMILRDPLARPVIGHRGNRVTAPENTLPAFGQAVAAGVEAVEFDVRLSADGVPVVIHDPTVDRTTDGRGAVAGMPLAALRELDAGARFTPDGGRTRPWSGRGVRIPTLDELLDSLPASLPVIIELKTPRVTAAVAEAIRRRALAPRVIVAGFDAASTAPMRGDPWMLGASTPEVARLLVPALLRQPLGALPFQALCIPPSWHGIPVPIAALARAGRQAGLALHLWTVNAPRQAHRWWRAGVQGIITDDPVTILRARAHAS
jgi:glycerophosphoryl diester phosphodiesterase